MKMQSTEPLQNSDRTFFQIVQQLDLSTTTNESKYQLLLDSMFELACPKSSVIRKNDQFVTIITLSLPMLHDNIIKYIHTKDNMIQIRNILNHGHHSNNEEETCLESFLNKHYYTNYFNIRDHFAKFMTEEQLLVLKETQKNLYDDLSNCIEILLIGFLIYEYEKSASLENNDSNRKTRSGGNISKTLDEEKNKLRKDFPDFFKGHLSGDVNDTEINQLALFRYVMKIALLLIQPRGNKGRLLDLVTRITEGCRKEYKTGSGQTKATSRRVMIYQQEGNVVPRPKIRRKQSNEGNLKSPLSISTESFEKPIKTDSVSSSRQTFTSSISTIEIIERQISVSSDLSFESSTPCFLDDTPFIVFDSKMYQEGIPPPSPTHRLVPPPSPNFRLIRTSTNNSTYSTQSNNSTENYFKVKSQSSLTYLGTEFVPPLSIPSYDEQQVLKGNIPLTGSTVPCDSNTSHPSINSPSTASCGGSKFIGNADLQRLTGHVPSPLGGATYPSNLRSTYGSNYSVESHRSNVSIGASPVCGIYASNLRSTYGSNHSVDSHRSNTSTGRLQIPVPQENHKNLRSTCSSHHSQDTQRSHTTATVVNAISQLAISCHNEIMATSTLQPRTYSPGIIQTDPLFFLDSNDSPRVEKDNFIYRFPDTTGAHVAATSSGASEEFAKIEPDIIVDTTSEYHNKSFLSLRSSVKSDYPIKHNSGDDSHSDDDDQNDDLISNFSDKDLFMNILDNTSQIYASSNRNSKMIETVKSDDQNLDHIIDANRQLSNNSIVSNLSNPIDQAQNLTISELDISRTTTNRDSELKRVSFADNIERASFAVSDFAVSEQFESMSINFAEYEQTRNDMNAGESDIGDSKRFSYNSSAGGSASSKKSQSFSSKVFSFFNKLLPTSSSSKDKDKEHQMRISEISSAFGEGNEGRNSYSSNKKYAGVIRPRSSSGHSMYSGFSQKLYSPSKDITVTGIVGIDSSNMVTSSKVSELNKSTGSRIYPSTKRLKRLVADKFKMSFGGPSEKSSNTATLNAHEISTSDVITALSEAK